MVVAGFAAHTDINKAHEVANEVRRVNKQMKECQQLAAMYNNRERLFEMPITNVSASRPSGPRPGPNQRSNPTCYLAEQWPGVCRVNITSLQAAFAFWRFTRISPVPNGDSKPTN